MRRRGQLEKLIVEGNLPAGDVDFALVPGDSLDGELAKAANLRWALQRKGR